MRVLDVLGCALGALSTPTASACVHVASSMGGKPEATLLGRGERVNASGKALLSAVIAGYQVTVPLARAAGAGHRESGFHASGTCNAPGAAMAVSEIYELDDEAASRAIGLAIEQAAGLCQYRGD